MYIIPQSPSASGAFPPLQHWGGLTPPAGYDICPEELDTADFYAYNGFVVLTVVRGVVSSYQPNTEAWESWQASRPPEPEPDDPESRILALLADGIREGVNGV